ncbi:MAG: hypothetical protein IPM99_19355 [Rubrivivax sp.]|nr:hypothetical protein [Rubrivivax sp.]
MNEPLDISKIDGSADSMVLRPGDLAALAATVVQELRPLADQRARWGCCCPSPCRGWPPRWTISASSR